MPIFQDHFLDNRNQWETRSDGVALLRLSPGDYAYLLDHKSASGAYLSLQPMAHNDEPYKVHAVLERVVGGSHAYGIVWRAKDKANCHCFVLTKSGHYQVRQCVNGAWQALTEWQSNEAVHGGQRSVNEMSVHQLEDRTLLGINGETVEEISLSMGEDGKFGLVVFGDLRVRAHSVTVWHSAEIEAATPEDEEPFGEIDEELLEEVLAELHQLIGMENIKGEIDSLVNYLKVQKWRLEREMKTMPLSLHMVLAGPPGTGKTTVARLISRIYHALGFLKKGHLVETDRAGLVAGYVGQTAMKVDEQVQKASGGVLFIDEAYSLMPKNSFGGNDFGQEAIEALLKRMEDKRGEFAVVIAGYADELHRFLDANPGVKSRFNRYFYFDHFSAEELLAIFELFVSKGGFTLTDDAKEKVGVIMEEAHASRTNSFGNGRFARNLLEKMVEKQADRIVSIEPMTDEVLASLTAEDVPDMAEEIIF